MAGRFVPRTTAVPRQQPAPEVSAAPQARVWTPPGPLDLRLVLGPLRRGPADPTYRALPDGTFWRATRT
ncbi:DNA-3-methyladenine glycosylase 2 family protein, partial [Streptomyces sp. SID3915]|nr:DNA-3-methyladenine glycosylase 2 family protein [Streptomyces sp. SID3915]